MHSFLPTEPRATRPYIRLLPLGARLPLVVPWLFLAALAAPEELPWPDCRVLAAGAGGPAIEVNHQIRAPLMFCGNNQFGRDEVLREELRLAAEAEIPFFVIQLKLPWTPPESEEGPDFEAANRMLSRFREAHPEAFVLLRVSLNPPKFWRDAHPDECIATAAGKRLPFAAPGSQQWRDAAERLLRGQLRAILEGPHAAHFAGVLLQHLHTGEWFYPEPNEFTDYSLANVWAFREWLRNEYGRDKRLQRAWDDGEVTMDSALIPAPEQRLAAEFGPFRHTQKHRPAMDLQRFQSGTIARTIIHFARLVKDVTRNRSLTGVFYGYTFELNGNGPHALANSGHLALRHLLECERLDLIAAPYSYFERAPGQPGHFHLPVDSIALHGKLAILEDDTYTHVSSPPPDGVPAPGWEARAKTLDETLDMARRNALQFLAHRCGVWFFDLLSDGRWNIPEFWDSTAFLRRMAAEMRGFDSFAPEIAVAVSESSAHFLQADTRPWLMESLYRWRAELARIGAPAGYYLQSDLPVLPESVKVLFLPNPYHMTEEEAEAIGKLLERGGTVVYTWAPGICNGEHPNPHRVERVTGFELHVEFDREGPVIIEDAFTGKTHRALPESWQPRFVIADDQGDTVATYADTGARCAAARPEGNGVVVYTAVPRLPVAVLRLICRRAGVHLYRDTPGMTAVAGPYLAVHTAAGPPDAARHTLWWPADTGNLTRLTPPSRLETFLEHAPKRSDVLPEKTTAVYRFEP